MAKEVVVPTDFYVDYILKNADFKARMDVRLGNIERDLRDLRLNRCGTTTHVIEENFVELFSWSVLPIHLLQEISGIIQGLGCNEVVDPCCGNGFHTYLFETYADGLTCSAFDIQDEPDSWSRVEVCDCRDLLTTKMPSHRHMCLLLSWIDYDELAVTMLRDFRGPVVLSIGNYEEGGSLNYLSALRANFSLVQKYTLEMPWSRAEIVEIYQRL